MGSQRVGHDWVTSLSLYQTPSSLPSSCFLFHRIHHHISPASICTHMFSFSFYYHRWIIHVPLFLVYSFGKIKTMIKSILRLCLVWTVSAERSWKKCVTMRQSHNHTFQVGLTVSQQSHCMSLVHVLSPLLEDDFITSSQMAQMVKRLPAMRESQVWSLGREDPLEKDMATHSSTFAWKIPQTEEPGML